MIDLVLLAASGLARELAAADLGEARIIGVLDDDADLHGTECAGLPILGGLDRAQELDAQFVLCIGSGRARREVLSRLGRLGIGEERFARAVDGSVRVPPSCRIGAGSIVLAGTVLTTDAAVGSHVVIMPNVTLTHDTIVEDFATLAAGVTLGGAVRVGEAAYLGMNASVRQGVSIGRDAVVGMGAAVLQSVPAGQVWAGVPARPIGHKGGES
ncbi:acetyltransferase [Microterricola viridarii]|uniref:Sugar O-acyltransferase, sialic acid O-acetyltransferase NeuD family n=1 Tax=Microterricola viridarii TaxID=412690 RepID=A0A1H1P7M5_9MICO|nr:acetyltransferase [Microterricola viridarii]SDS07163.1 sugar O-acyltransferase, sialic acid O-acetyltransferase NeuD family [Microterricola viridarii]